MIRRPPRSTLFPTRRSSDLDLLPLIGRDDHERRGPYGGQYRGERSQSALPVRKQHKPSQDRKSTRLNSSHANISYAVFCLKKKNKIKNKYNTVIRIFNVQLY